MRDASVVRVATVTTNSNRRLLMNLVIGATGLLGSEICARLRVNGEPVRGLVRSTSDAAKVKRLQAIGVDPMLGDLRDPRSLEAACRGVQTLIVTASAMPFAYEPEKNTPATTDRDGMFNLIGAARAARVRHIVYTSFTGAIDRPFPLSEAKRAVEQKLAESGLTYTILRPNFFMDVWLTPAVGFDVGQGRVRLYGDGNHPIAWIAVRDVAAYAIASLQHTRAIDATVDLDGPAAVSPLAVVAIFERFLGRSIALEHVSEQALMEQQRAASDPMQKSFAALMLAYARGSVSRRTRTQDSYGLPLTTVEEYAQQVLHRRESATLA
jgi:uncharacterized protein YbjT (DUF2867 family)